MAPKFWDKVSRLDDCWEWIAGCNGQGYGSFRSKLFPQDTLAHRVSWTIATGSPPPKGIGVLHSCDNPRCVRPDHLFLGTQAANVADMMAKRRHRSHKGTNYMPCGMGHCFFLRGRKLTRAQAAEIRASAETQAALAVRFGVDPSNISRIKTGKLWRLPDHATSVLKKPKPPRGAPAKSLEERFWSKVIKGEGCWIWTKKLTPAGRGTFHVPAKPRWKTKLAHRVSWELTFGPIPAGLGVLHSCDTPACVKPTHLFLGTQLANVRDCIVKGRQRPADDMRGERNPMYRRGHKLAREEAYAIRADVGTIYEVAARWGISPSMVSLIRRGEAWTHSTVP